MPQRTVVLLWGPLQPLGRQSAMPPTAPVFPKRLVSRSRSWRARASRSTDSKLWPALNRCQEHHIRRTEYRGARYSALPVRIVLHPESWPLDAYNSRRPLATPMQYTNAGLPLGSMERRDVYRVTDERHHASSLVARVGAGPISRRLWAAPRWGYAAGSCTAQYTYWSSAGSQASSMRATTVAQPGAAQGRKLSAAPQARQ